MHVYDSVHLLLWDTPLQVRLLLFPKIDNQIGRGTQWVASIVTHYPTITRF
jgi:hypothetical protein